MYCIEHTDVNNCIIIFVINWDFVAYFVLSDFYCFLQLFFFLTMFLNSPVSTVKQTKYYH